jgi:competence protein ComEC
MELVQITPGYKYHLWPAPQWWLVGYYLGLILVYYFRANPKYWIICSMAWLAIYPAFNPAPMEPNSARLTLLSLNIGESALIESNNQSRVLIDTGSEKEFLWRVKPFLASRGIQTLDALIISHGDDDHAGGLRECLRYFKVNEIIFVPWKIKSHDLIKHLERKMVWHQPKVKILTLGQIATLDPNLKLTGVWPPRGTYQINNEQCLALIIQTIGGNMLFTGDCGSGAESKMAIPIPIRIFKAGHHGDNYANTDDLLVRIKPELSIITPGNSNPFGLPDEETQSRLQQYSNVVLNTKSQGAIEIKMKPNQPLEWSFIAPTRE